MTTTVIANSFIEFVQKIDRIKFLGDEIHLFRGQHENKPLLPSIARTDNTIDTTKLEIEMLDELKRRSKLIVGNNLLTDWDWLIYAQHYGMKTRLLDWTSNPLVALWFACYNAPSTNYVYVYVLSASRDLLVTKETDTPFNYSKTRILKPVLNNERIVAQAGWFTAHIFSNGAKRFVPLENNANINSKIVIIKIPNPKNITDDFISRLSIFGINSQSLFPDIMGLCQHLNWSHGV